MERLLQRLIQVMALATGLGIVVLVGMWNLLAGFICLSFGVGVTLWAIRRGAFTIARTPVREEVNTEREAKYLVTQILRNLTLIQVAYLCQSFKSREESRAWLKKTLPRSFRSSLDELHRNLENERMGVEVPGLRLARRILALRSRILGLEDALAVAHRQRPSYSVAHPVVFVVTEYLDQTDCQEPPVITLAGWNPAQPTLLPEVNAVTFLSEEDSEGKYVRGQSDFAEIVGHLSAFLSPVAGKETVFAAQPVEDPVKHGVKVDKVPLGFVIGTAEFL